MRLSCYRQSVPCAVSVWIIAWIVSCFSEWIYVALYSALDPASTAICSVVRPAPTVSVTPALSTFSGVLLWAPPSGIQHFRSHSCHGKLPVIFCLLLLILSGDIELNPGTVVNQFNSAIFKVA